jgi:hypothetical protein
MNHPVHLRLHRPNHHWLRDVQFAVGVVVATGGAAVLLSEAVRLFV